MIRYILYLIYIIMFVAPSIYTGLYPFRHKFKIKLRYIVILYLMLFLTHYIGDAILIKLSQSEDIIIIYRSIMSWIYALVAWSILDARLSKIMFVYLALTLFYGVSMNGLSEFLILSKIINPSLENNEVVMGIILLFMAIATVPIIFYFIKKIITPMLEVVEDEVWDSISIILVTICIISMILLYINYDSNNTKTINLVIGLIVVVSIIATVMILVNSLNSHRKNIQLQNELDSMDKIMLIQQEQYIDLSKRVAETKQIRHNKRHHLNAVNNYISKNDKDGLFDYIKSYIEEIPMEDVTYCENNTINNILSHYVSVANLDDIDISIKAILPTEEGYNLSSIKKTDLWILLGNILENSIEACNRTKKDGKIIKIRINLINDMLIVIVDNSYNGIIRKYKEEYFYSSKEESRVGIGIESIKRISNKYGGICKFEYDKNIFYTSVMLKVG